MRAVVDLDGGRDRPCPVRLRAVGRVMQLGRSTSVGAADVYAIAADGTATLCGAVLATGRVYLPRDAAQDVEPATGAAA